MSAFFWFQLLITSVMKNAGKIFVNGILRDL